MSGLRAGVVGGLGRLRHVGGPVEAGGGVGWAGVPRVGHRERWDRRVGGGSGLIDLAEVARARARPVLVWNADESFLAIGRERALAASAHERGFRAAAGYAEGGEDDDRGEEALHSPHATVGPAGDRASHGESSGFRWILRLRPSAAMGLTGLASSIDRRTCRGSWARLRAPWRLRTARLFVVACGADREAELSITLLRHLGDDRGAFGERSPQVGSARDAELGRRNEPAACASAGSVDLDEDAVRLDQFDFAVNDRADRQAPPRRR